MTTTFFLLSLLNFLIIYGSIFYVMQLKVTIQRVLSCLLVNTIVSLLAVQFPQSLWIPMICSICFSSGIFYLLTRQQIVLVHLVTIHIISILAEYTALLFVEALNLSVFIHGSLIIIQVVFVVILYKRLLLYYKKDIRFSIQSRIVLTVIVCITFVVFYAMVFVPFGNKELEVSVATLLLLFFYFFIMVGLVSILLHTIGKENRAHEKMVEQQQFAMYMQALEQVNRDMQTFRHDYANILLSLRGYIELEDMEGLRNYFQEEIVKVEQRTLFKNQVFSQLDRLQLVEIKGIIATKILLADELGIPFNVEVPETIEVISINKIHLSRILGILIDNAIEASASMEQPCINLAFLTVSKKSVIVIENRFAGDIEFNRLFEDGYSTKGNDRGKGLPAVRSILSSYPSIIFNSRTEDQWMIHEIVIEGANEHASHHM